MRHVSLLRTVAMVFAPLAMLPGCTDGRTNGGDERQINALLLAVLTSDGTRICVDRETKGEPLAVFRAMLPAPEPARRPLGWSVPGPLEPGRTLTGRELVNSEMRGEHIVLPERATNKGRLSVINQIQLNDVARQAAFVLTFPAVTIENVPTAPRARVRWWLWNRLDTSCRPIYTVSKPVIFRDMAFVTVTAAHQGSTYSFRKTGNSWAAFAKWSNWLY